MERDLILPVKLMLVIYLFFNVFLSEWFWDPVTTRELIQNIIKWVFFFYAILNVLAARIFLSANTIALGTLRATVMGSCILDSLMLACLTFITDGFDSSLFFVFLALVVRNVISMPAMGPQLFLQLSTNLSYVSAGLMDLWISQADAGFMNSSSRQILELDPGQNTEPFLLRVALLALLSACCYAVQVLFERQRLTQEEGREFALRNEQVKTAGRLAGEIAHQIKNPLSIINNTAWSLKRSLKGSSEIAAQQIDIIREEVERSDQILTELMGYARLADGNVERLDVNNELDACIETVFPSAAGFDTRAVKYYQRNLPSLLMQQGHLREIFTNLLQNARESMDSKGEIRITTKQDPDDAIVVVVEDVGSGIESDKLEQVFEAYFTTKPKGTGLGLAIVRNNVELYGGSIHAESELGQGSRFVIRFPPRSPRK
jgi:signal transduction histidine kinase